MTYNKRFFNLIKLFIAIVILFQGFTVGAESSYLGGEEIPINKNNFHRPQYIEGEYIIKYKDSTSQYKKINIYNREKINLIESLDEINTDVVEVRSKFSLNKTLERLENNPDVEFIEPNYLYYPMEMGTNEPEFNKLWGMENIGQDIKGTLGTPNVDIDIVDGWKYTKGSEDVVVAVIDTGIDIAHPDLKDNIWINDKEILNGKDSDGNGYIDDIHGWDFFNDNNSVYNYEDEDIHGTHVAGTIAAGINGIGIAGVAPNVKIMPLKFMGINKHGNSEGSLSDVLKAIAYAKDKGVKIVNASWGNYMYSKLLEDAIKESGMLFLAASGNEEFNTDLMPSYPANFDLPNIISIGAVNNQGGYADFSNYGKTTVHVAAPGQDILSTTPLNRYQSAAIYNEKNNYRTLFQAFGLEIFATPKERIEIMGKSLDMLKIDRESSILLVQDDESDHRDYKDYLSYYKEPLEKLGFLSLDVHKVKQRGDGPSFNEMKDYDLVLWFTGEGYGDLNGSITTITNVDQENLVQYLDYGGKLYLSGRDAGEKIEETIFYRQYLGAELKSQIGEPTQGEEKWKNVIIGREGTVFQQDSYITNNIKYSDIITPINGSKAVMEYGNSDKYYSSYMYGNGTSMSTPHVSGIAALLYSLGEKDILSIKSLIMRGVKPINGLEDMLLTGGLVNASNSINKYLDGKTNYVTDIELDIDTIELDTTFDSGYIFNPSITPLNADDKRIRWLSSDEKVVVVNSEGRAQAIGKGDAIITAITLDGGYIQKVNVIVDEYDYPIIISDAIIDNQEVVVKLKMVSNDIEGTVIVQAYDENHRPIKVMYSGTEILNKEYNFNFGETIKPISHVRVFVWDNLKNMKPLAASL